MILFDLKCANDHVFEAWFKDSETFERQAEDAEIVCPVCGDSGVEKALMAPRIGKGDREIATKAAEHAKRYAAFASEVRRRVEDNCDYVGPKFSEEARKIHHGEVEKRNIYGDASKEEAKELREEGIEISQMPWVPRHDS